ncbi:hypothetical protein, partial [Enterobacter roggenkampii]|uniref:hypothetical protein n=1 Tax=Enterobacter roggenkampii TaxID=1812935 RepID=UPI002FFBE3C7
EGIPAAADIVNLRYKSCSEMEGQDHLVFINNFMVIQGEYTVKGEQWSVHLMAIAGKKKTGCCRSGVGYVAAGSSHFGSQSP